MDPWTVLQPESPFHRLLSEAMTRGAETIRAAERQDLAQQSGDRMAAVVIEVLVAAGVLTRKT